MGVKKPLGPRAHVEPVRGSDSKKEKHCTKDGEPTHALEKPTRGMRKFKDSGEKSS